MEIHQDSNFSTWGITFGDAIIGCVFFQQELLKSRMQSISAMSLFSPRHSISWGDVQDSGIKPFNHFSNIFKLICPWSLKSSPASQIFKVFVVSFAVMNALYFQFGKQIHWLTTHSYLCPLVLFYRWRYVVSPMNNSLGVLKIWKHRQAISKYQQNILFHPICTKTHCLTRDLKFPLLVLLYSTAIIVVSPVALSLVL